MEDDKIKDFFAGFNPDMPSDISFVSRLQQNLDAVEMVRQHNVALRRRNRVAVAVAAVVGFATGFLFSLALPYIGSVVASLAVPADSALRVLYDNYLAIAWLLIGGTSALIALNAYDLTLSLEANHH
ncbi:MAG: hypothetical protein K2F77_09320 [Muribaculaceae bacterium]|nr:hypothetical protein [Muribaculaceae bacterium]